MKNRILIIEEDLTQIHYLKKNFKPYVSIDADFANTMDLALTSIKSNRYSIIFLNMFASNYDGNEILSYMRLNNILDKTKVIMISELYNNYISDIIKKNKVYYFIHKPYAFENIIELAINLLTIVKPSDIVKSSDIIDNSDSFHKKETGSFFADINFKESLLGYGFALTAICYCASLDTLENITVTKDIYPYVAKVHNVNLKCVERNIRHSIQTTFEKNDTSSYFMNLEIAEYKIPSNKRFIFNIATYIKNKGNKKVA